MPTITVNGAALHHEVSGSGSPVVLVHGSWSDHTTWYLVRPALSERHTVVAYDRRGHGRSDRPAGTGPRRVEEDDLAALVEALDLGPVDVVGTSYGGAVALGLAARRPDLVGRVSAHEPPLVGATAGTPAAPLAAAVLAVVESIAHDLRRGDLPGGAQRFVDEVALGPGAWTMLPDVARQTMVASAPAFLDMLADPAWAAPTAPADPATPVLLTEGAASPAALPAIVAAVAATTHPHADRHTFGGAGHVPHGTHPAAFVARIEAFLTGARVG
jgi:pimeloyl-ACP methyl ester carboxylesterase